LKREILYANIPTIFFSFIQKGSLFFPVNSQLHLCNKSRRLFGRENSKQAITTAIARELSAFIWVIDKQMQQLTA
jgi:hypothetical protein